MSALRRILPIVGRRLVLIVPLMFVVILVSFSLMFLIPGDPAHRIAGEAATPAQIEAVRHDLGLDQPVPVRLLNYIQGLLTGDLGTSYTFKTPVADMILTRLPVTVSMIVVAMGFALLIGVPAGVWAGRRAGAWQDRAVTTVSTLGLATPNFVLGLLLVLLLAVWSGLLPATGYTSISEGLWPWLRHLLMPGFALGAVAAAEIARQLRAAMADAMRQDYVRTAIAKGMLPRAVIWRHALKNALMPVVTVVGIQVGYLLGGTAVVETIFGLKGLGDFAVQAVLAGDIPAIQGMVVFAVGIVVLISLVVDLTYSYLNPRGEAQ